MDCLYMYEVQNSSFTQNDCVLSIEYTRLCMYIPAQSCIVHNHWILHSHYDCLKCNKMYNSPMFFLFWMTPILKKIIEWKYSYIFIASLYLVNVPRTIDIETMGLSFLQPSQLHTCIKFYLYLDFAVTNVQNLVFWTIFVVDRTESLLCFWVVLCKYFYPLIVRIDNIIRTYVCQ